MIAHMLMSEMMENDSTTMKNDSSMMNNGSSKKMMVEKKGYLKLYSSITPPV